MLNSPMPDENSPDKQISVGTPVFAANGDQIGAVSKQGIEGGQLFVQKGRLFPEVFSVPLTAIVEHSAEGILLNLSKDELGLH